MLSQEVLAPTYVRRRLGPVHVERRVFDVREATAPCYFYTGRGGPVRGRTVVARASELGTVRSAGRVTFDCDAPAMSATDGGRQRGGRRDPHSGGRGGGHRTVDGRGGGNVVKSWWPGHRKRRWSRRTAGRVIRIACEGIATFSEKIARTGAWRVVTTILLWTIRFSLCILDCLFFYNVLGKIHCYVVLYTSNVVSYKIIVSQMN